MLDWIMLEKIYEALGKLIFADSPMSNIRILVSPNYDNIILKLLNENIIGMPIHDITTLYGIQYSREGYENAIIVYDYVKASTDPNFIIRIVI
jgi:hypothetical protein